MYKYKNKHNHQQADDWLWDTIPNTMQHLFPHPFALHVDIRFA